MSNKPTHCTNCNAIMTEGEELRHLQECKQHDIDPDEAWRLCNHCEAARNRCQQAAYEAETSYYYEY